MQSRQEIKVGDVGTVYFIPTFDNDTALQNFDPSAAVTKDLFFKMPGASGLIKRTATAAQKTIGGVSVWGLEYTVVAADVVPGGFHQAPGLVEIEAYLEFSANQKWSSATVRRDQQGRDLRIFARLV